ncbi:MAG TPA: ester cyclase [Gaiellaceae bacterium]|nr:ester cyclase [Gaiellaceae bacterium]
MTAAELTPEGTVRRLFDALNAQDFESAAGAVAEHCRWESVAAETAHTGSQPIVNGLRAFAHAFPDWHAEITSLVVQGSIVVVEWASGGTFNGDAFRGEAPNGRSFHRRGCAVAEVEGGKIVAYRDYYDRATMLDQLDLRHLL